MTLNTRLVVRGFGLSAVEQRRIEHHLRALERRLAHHPDPSVVLVVERHAQQQRVEANLRLQLTPLGTHLVSHQAAGTVDRAVRQAVQDLEGQIERRLAGQRGEPAFGTPSRRLPARLRPSAVVEGAEVVAGESQPKEAPVPVARLVPELEAELQSLLERERDRLGGSIRSLAQTEQMLSESQGEESDAGGGQADVASDLAETELSVGLERVQQARLGEVEGALRRLAQGQYGLCERCGEPIPLDRLRAVPWTRTCVRCA